MASSLFLALLLFASTALAICLFRILWTRPSRGRGLAVNLTLSYTVCLLGLLAVEAAFHFYLAPSSGWDFTLNGRRWRELHWQPVNSQGYRDVEWDAAELARRKVLLVLGDSFANGQGVADYRDRFSGVLQEKLGEAWAVVNAARNGWNTELEYQALVSYPAKPDAVLLAYFLNDVQDAAARAGVLGPRDPVTKPGGLPGVLVGHSYLADLIYWRWYRFRGGYYGGDYWQTLKGLFADPEVWRVHQGQLLEIIDYCRGERIKLWVAVFPQMLDVAGSLPLTQQVAGFFAGRGVAAVDLGPLFSGREAKDLVASSLDAHPNREVHREVGELLFDLFFGALATESGK